MEWSALIFVVCVLGFLIDTCLTANAALHQCSQLLHTENLKKTFFHEGRITAVEAPRSTPAFNQSYIHEVNLGRSCVLPQSEDIPFDCEEDMCYHLLFRTMDGSCNNLLHPEWGSAFSQLTRLEPPVYDDGFGIPTGIDIPGKPTSRDASRRLLSTKKEVYDDRFNELLMVWGQFLAHDITKTSKLASNVSCETCFPADGSHCIAVKVPLTDPNHLEFGCQNVFFHGAFIPRLTCCLRSTRSSPVCGTGTNQTEPRQQYNENTAFIDASMVYGSSVADMTKLRNGTSGYLLSSKINGLDYLPYNTSNCNDTVCEYNFFAGDERVDLFMGLTAMHVIFMRLHNKMVHELQTLNPHWNGDRLFQETRKIVGAIIQKVTFDDWLPKIFGQSEFDRRIGSYGGYDKMLNPTISNVFATSALRFGHGMVIGHFFRFDNDGIEIPERGISVLDTVFNATRLINEGGIDPIMNGIQTSKAKIPRGVTQVLTRRLFGNTDLTALNIERGREHGLPGYNTWRKHCGLTDAKSFQDLRQDILSQETLRVLEIMYHNTDTIDLYVAQLLEEFIPGGLIGPTLACLLSEQFLALRDGDRFWYENSGVFTKDQLEQIKSVSLPKIICQHSDGMNRVPPLAFVYHSFHELVDCETIEDMTLGPWKERSHDS